MVHEASKVVNLAADTPPISQVNCVKFGAILLIHELAEGVLDVNRL